MAYPVLSGRIGCWGVFAELAHYPKASRWKT
jgi:hypothetical protein